MLKAHKNIILGTLVTIIIFFGYWYLFLSKKTDTVSKKTNITNSVQKTQDKSTYDKAFVSSIHTIQGITLNTSILESSAYKALSFPEKPFEVNYNIPIGRRNPFLPIGSNGQEGGDEITKTQSIVTEEIPPLVEATSTDIIKSTKPVNPTRRR